MDDASERAIEEDMLDQFNYFDDEDEELIDRREPAPLDSFDLVDEEPNEDEGESTEPPQSSRLDSLLSRVPMHHGARAGALHMKTDWRQIVTAGDELAVDAPLTDKSSIICRTGMLMLASGTGAWRVRDTMNRVAAVLGVTIHVDLSLLSFECTCIEDGHCFNEVVSLPTTGVNTHRIWMMESFLKEIETYGRRFTVHEYHEMLKTVESSKPDYASWQQGLAAACACGAFVFLLGGGPIEMACAFVGAGVGNFARSHILKQGLGQFSALTTGVALACVSYLLALLGLGQVIPGAMSHQEGYIGAMLFVIPGFPLITAGLDIAKLDMRSGIERLSYAVSIIVMATLVGWMVAECVGLAPDDFAPLGLSPLALTLLRVVMSFVGVFGFSVMFNSPVKMAAAAGLIGAVSNTLRLTLVDASLPGPQRGNASRGGSVYRRAGIGAAGKLGRSQAHLPTYRPHGAINCHYGAGPVSVSLDVLHVHLRYGQYARLVCACSAHRGVFARWSGCGTYTHRPSLAPHQLIGAKGTGYFAPPMSCGEIGTELLLKGSKQSVFHRNLWGRGGIIGALHLHKLNAYEARAVRVRVVPPHK